MNNYLVTLIFQIQTENHKGKAQFDEQVKLVQAETLQAVWTKAALLGKSEEILFENSNQQKVSWTFIAVSDVFSLQHIRDGQPVFTHTHEAESAYHFINQIREKSKVSQSYHSIADAG